MEDTQQQDFFRSVTEAFERNRETASQSFELVLLGLVILLSAMQAIAFWRRRRGLRLDVEQLAHQRGLTRDELALMLDLARVAAVPPMELLTHLDTFERVTARALGGTLTAFLSGEPLASQLHRVRHVLHFDRLPTHAPLLTTRELSPGTAVQVGADQGQVSVVNESRFEVDLHGPVATRPGETAMLVLTHAREARYELRCKVVEAHGPRLVLAHDEAPTRVQQREYVRVRVSGPIALAAVSWPGHSIEHREVQGTLVDLSAGGALLTSHAVFPPGVRFAATFTVAGQAFTRLEGVVLMTHAKDAGTFELHVEFPRLSAPERERLIGAVAKLQSGDQRATPT